MKSEAFKSKEVQKKLADFMVSLRKYMDRVDLTVDAMYKETLDFLHTMPWDDKESVGSEIMKITANGSNSSKRPKNLSAPTPRAHNTQTP